MVGSWRFWQAEAMKRFLQTLALGLCLSALAGSALLWAEAEPEWRDLHAEVQAGRLVAMPQILDWLETHYVGTVLEVELERDDGMTLYEVEMIGPQGQLVEFDFDATDGELIGIEGVNIDAMERP
jgi:hypothetical protein